MASCINQTDTMNCTLCTKEPLKPQPYSDGVCWATHCVIHDVPMIVLNRHTESPTGLELHHMKAIAEEVFPGYRWRNPRSMPEHFHLHSDGRAREVIEQVQGIG